MNVNRLLECASNGDVDAMKQLSAYYDENNDEENEIKWDYLAKNTQYASITILTMFTDALGAIGAEGIAAWDEAESKWKKIYNKADEIIGMYNDGDIIISSENLDSVKCKLIDAKAGLARIAMIRDQNYQLANELLQDIKCQSVYTMVLYGICCIEIDDLPAAYISLRSVFEDRNYADLKKSKLEEFFYSQGMHYYSRLCRIGLPSLAYADCQKAVQVLNQTITVIEDNEMRAILQSELSRYKKKLFGGYKYVG